MADKPFTKAERAEKARLAADTKRTKADAAEKRRSEEATLLTTAAGVSTDPKADAKAKAKADKTDTANKPNVPNAMGF